MRFQSLFFLSQTCHKSTFATFTASEIKQNALSPSRREGWGYAALPEPFKRKKIIWSASSESCK